MDRKDLEDQCVSMREVTREAIDVERKLLVRWRVTSRKILMRSNRLWRTRKERTNRCSRASSLLWTT